MEADDWETIINIASKHDLEYVHSTIIQETKLVNEYSRAHNFLYKVSERELAKAGLIFDNRISEIKIPPKEKSLLNDFESFNDLVEEIIDEFDKTKSYSIILKSDIDMGLVNKWYTGVNNTYNFNAFSEKFNKKFPNFKMDSVSDNFEKITFTFSYI